MRNRTELVTQNYLDSQDDDSESDESEDDWRPAVDRQKLSRKRPNNIPAGKHRKMKKKAASNTKSKYTEDNSSESESGEEVFYSQSSHSSAFDVDAGASSYKTKSSEKNYPDRNGIFQLYVYKKDLLSNYATDDKLCLWRWDGDLLLQKYIRIKDSHHQFVFTSSSVYSNWNEQRKNDFEIIDVKCLEENDRRVILLNPKKFHELAEKNSARFAESNGFKDGGHEREEDDFE
ncbi:hypothetical protein ACFFRR_000886 [Megaselia abdita]